MKKNKWITVLAFTIVFVIPLILFTYWFNKERPTVGTLPIFGEHTAVERTDSSGQSFIDTLYHSTSPFRVITQLGDTVTEALLKDRVALVSFIAIGDPLSAQVMENMNSLQEEFLEEDRVQLLTYDVGNDSVRLPELYRYGVDHGVNHNRWLMLTVDGLNAEELLSAQYLLTPETNAVGRLLSHQLVLIDMERRIRGYYDGTDPEAVAQARIDTKRLLIGYFVESYQEEKSK